MFSTISDKENHQAYVSSLLHTVLMDDYQGMLKMHPSGVVVKGVRYKNVKSLTDEAKRELKRKVLKIVEGRLGYEK